MLNQDERWEIGYGDFENILSLISHFSHLISHILFFNVSINLSTLSSVKCS